MSISFRCFLPKLPGWSQEHQPVTDENHQSTRNGVFLCGDLTGEPLLKTSLLDASETAKAASKWLRANRQDVNAEFDTLICGAGGAGLNAAIELKKLGHSCLVLEKNKIAQTIRDFPIGKTLFARPYDLKIDSPLDFEDCTKEEYLKQIEKVIKDQKLDIKEDEELVEIKDAETGELCVKTANGETFTGRSIILAFGRGGYSRQLGIIGEDLSHVHHKLLTPHGYDGRQVMVIGGGDSAVKSALALAESGAKVTISYRKDSFYRISEKNRELLEKQISDENLRVVFKSKPIKIEKDIVILKTLEEDIQAPAEDVFVMIGAEPPKKLLNDLGVKIENRWNRKRFIYLALSIIALWLFYSFAKWGSGESLREFPWSLLGPSSKVLPDWLNPGIFKGLAYSLIVIAFGIPAMRRWTKMRRYKNYQSARYLTIFFSQAILLFIVPEFILPLLDKSGNAWRFYGVVMPFPLVYETFFYGPTLFWLIACAAAMLIVLPIFVYWHGKRLCSWICGCGCLAETLGDRWRHYAPQGENSRKTENMLLWPVLAWAFISAGIFIMTQKGSGLQPFYVKSYIFIVDFLLASVLGVALYFFLGNRIWCRYFCPLAHYMRLLSSIYGKFRIKPADRCIACGECERHCQMGIDVMQHALKKEEINNKNSSCIGCNICVSICPMDNLTSGKEFPNVDGNPHY